MRHVLITLAATSVAVAIAAETPGQSTRPAAATVPATRPAWADRPTPMLSAILATGRTGRGTIFRPPLRRGFNPDPGLIGQPLTGQAALKARAAAAALTATTQLGTTPPGATATTARPAATGPAATQRVVTVVLATTRPTTAPAVPTRLKIDLDNADAAGLTAALGTPVALQGARQAMGPNAWQMLPPTPVTYHGPAGTFAAAVADLFQNGGLTVLENYSNLTLSPGKPLRALNLNDAGALVLTRLTLSARRNTAADATQYDYRLDGVFLPDPASRVVAVNSNGSLQLAGTPEVFRPNNDFSGGNGNRVSLSFTSDRPIKKADVLAGRVRAMRVVDEDAVDVPFEQIADGQPVTEGNLTVLVDVPNAGGGDPSLRVKITGKAVAMFSDYRWNNTARQCVRVLGYDGVPLPTEAFVQNTSNDSVTVMVRANALRASDFFDRLTTVSVRLPRALKAVDLPFTLDGVAFPGD